MWGSIIGDIAGSIYEYDQTKGVHPVEVDKIIEDDAFFSDDTILTVAVADAIVHGDDIYSKYIKQYGNEYRNYLPKFQPYFKTIFSPGFMKYLDGESDMKSEGNGALMRISPVGYLFNKPSEVATEAIWATGITHDNTVAKSDAMLVALLTYFFRQGYTKEQAIAEIKKLENKGYSFRPIDLKYKSFETFNKTCSETMDNVLYALFISKDYEDAIRTVISFGGDTDTNACIVGGMAEALYGVPEYLVEQAKERVPKQFVKVIDSAYAMMDRDKHVNI